MTLYDIWNTSPNITQCSKYVPQRDIIHLHNLGPEPAGTAGQYNTLYNIVQHTSCIILIVFCNRIFSAQPGPGAAPAGPAPRWAPPASAGRPPAQRRNWSNELVKWTGQMNWLNRASAGTGQMNWSQELVKWRTGQMNWSNELVEWRNEPVEWTGHKNWSNELVEWTGQTWPDDGAGRANHTGRAERISKGQIRSNCGQIVVKLWSKRLARCCASRGVGKIDIESNVHNDNEGNNYTHNQVKKGETCAMAPSAL